MPLRAGELAERLQAALEGDPDVELAGVAPIETAGPGELAFATGRKAAELAGRSRAGCLLLAPGVPSPATRCVIRVADPRAAFARAVRWFHPEAGIEPGLHPTAVIAPDARLGDRVHIGPQAVIGEGVQIGSGTRIGAGCYIGRESSLGEGCTLHPNVTIYHQVRIGNRVTIHSGAVIGADGFGFVLVGDRYEKFPQIGRVEIGDDVEIGANCTIDRAALGVTSIGEGTKLDNLVHVAHNCRIGRHVVVAAQTGFSGGVVVEDYAVIGGQVGIGDKARIESHAVLGSGCGVLTSKVIRSGQVVWGTPARPLKEYLELLAHLGRLPALREEVEELKRRLAALEGRK